MSSGTDQTDTEEIKKRGIRLGNTTKVLDNAVADITVALMITAARRFKEAVHELERYIAVRQWYPRVVVPLHLKLRVKLSLKK